MKYPVDIENNEIISIEIYGILCLRSFLLRSAMSAGLIRRESEGERKITRKVGEKDENNRKGIFNLEKEELRNPRRVVELKIFSFWRMAKRNSGGGWVRMLGNVLEGWSMDGTFLSSENLHVCSAFLHDSRCLDCRHDTFRSTWGCFKVLLLGKNFEIIFSLGFVSKFRHELKIC